MQTFIFLFFYFFKYWAVHVVTLLNIPRRLFQLGSRPTSEKYSPHGYQIGVCTWALPYKVEGGRTEKTYKQNLPCTHIPRLTRIVLVSNPALK